MADTRAYAPPFAAFHQEILRRGVDGERPPYPVALAELARQVQAAGEPRAMDYLFGAAGTEDTMRANEEAFRRWRIVPRMLRDVAHRDLSVRVLNTDLPAPVALAPIGAQTMMHADGELATARAAAAVGLPMAVSTMSSFALEEVAGAAQGPKWFQLYWGTRPDLVESFVGRAEAAGYRAIILTLDAGLAAWRIRDLQWAWQPSVHGIGIANYLSDPAFRAGLDRPPEEDLPAAIEAFAGQFVNPGLTWSDLEFLRSRTTLPIALKGILHPEDARLAREHGIDAVVVSNHGGRQLDGAIAALDALPAIVDAVGGDLQVLLDSGVRSGADIVKALALGADAVLIGRPFVWGLAAGGEDGALAVLRGMLADLDLTLGLTGHAAPGELNPGILVREGVG